MSSFPPLPSPPLSSPVAIIEPTTTSAVSSPGQYMSPCCTPNQQREPLPHTNLSWKPLLHLDLFQLAGWSACWVYSFTVCLLYSIFAFILFLIFCFGDFYFLVIGFFFFWLLQSGYIILLAACAITLPRPLFSAITTPPPPPAPPLGSNSVIKWLLHFPLGLMLFIMLMASFSLSLNNTLLLPATC